MKILWHYRSLGAVLWAVIFTSPLHVLAQGVSTGIGGITATPTRVGPASVVWNPAVLGATSGTQLETNISLVGGWLIYDREGTDPNTGGEFDSISTSIMAPNPFFSMSSDFGLDHFRFGYATYFPSGAIARYPEEGSQRYDLVRGLFVPWNHQFTLAFAPNSRFSFGVSGIYSLGFLKAELDIDLAPTLSQLLGSADIPKENPVLSSRADIPLTRAHSFGLGFGVLFRPSLQWSIGTSFYLPVSYWFEQDLNLSMPSIVTALGAAPQSVGLSDEVSNRVRIHSQIPAHLNLGVRYQPYGYWTGEYFGRYLFSSKSQYTSIHFESSPIRKLEGVDIKGPTGKDAFAIGSVQNFMFWPRFHFGISGVYSKNGLEDQYVSTSRIEFDSISVGLFFRYRLYTSLRLGMEYAHSFLFDREVYAGPQTASKDLNVFQKPASDGKYRASMDRVGVHLSYDF